MAGRQVGEGARSPARRRRRRHADRGRADVTGRDQDSRIADTSTASGSEARTKTPAVTPRLVRMNVEAPGINEKWKLGYVIDTTAHVRHVDASGRPRPCDGPGVGAHSATTTLASSPTSSPSGPVGTASRSPSCSPVPRGGTFVRKARGNRDRDGRHRVRPHPVAATKGSACWHKLSGFDREAGGIEGRSQDSTTSPTAVPSSLWAPAPTGAVRRASGRRPAVIHGVRVPTCEPGTP